MGTQGGSPRKETLIFVLKVGLEYAFAIANGWATGVTVAYDFKEEYNSWAFGLSVGRRF